MNRDGSGRLKVFAYPLGTLMHISPDRRWLLAIVSPLDGNPVGGTVAIPTSGGSPLPVCIARHRLPAYPADRLASTGKAGTPPGTAVIEQNAVIAGPDPSIYAYIKPATHRNLFRITLR